MERHIALQIEHEISRDVPMSFIELYSFKHSIRIFIDFNGSSTVGGMLSALLYVSLSCVHYSKCN